MKGWAGSATAWTLTETDSIKETRLVTSQTIWMTVLAMGVSLLAASSVSAQSQLGSGAGSVTVTETPIDGFPHSVLYLVPNERPRPVVVILGGAEGGNGAGSRFGPILARLGYAAVGLTYYSPDWGDFAPPPEFPEVPGSFIDIRIDQLEELRDEFGVPGVDVQRFGLFSGSKGSEFALIAATRYPWISSVVAYTPSDLVWEGWGLEMLDAEGTRSSFSFDGEPLAFMPYRGFVKGLEAGPDADLRAIHENGREDHPELEESARIPLEDFRGALMLVAGERDAQWNSAGMARNIQETRAAAGLTTEMLIYPEAGHNIAGGQAEPIDDPRSGGTPEADANARIDAWPRVLAFLERTLNP